MPGEQSFPAIRNALETGFGVRLPAYDKIPKMDAKAHLDGFLAFAKFVQGNLNGQTSIRVDAAWASQTELLRGMAEFNLPDHVFRESDLAADLDFLAAAIGNTSPGIGADDLKSPVLLEDIYDANVEAAVRACYQRDYMMFGFGSWQG